MSSPYCAHGVDTFDDVCARCVADVAEFKAGSLSRAVTSAQRHQAAVAAMQGLLAGGSYVGTHAAKAAVTIADALLEELAR